MTRSTGRSIRGFSLVEVVISLGIFAMILVGLFGLLASGLSSGRLAMEITDASHMAGVLLAECEVPPTTDPLFPPLVVAEPPPNGVNGTLYVNRDGEAVSNPAQAVYRVDYRIDQIAADSTRPGTVWLRLSWPAGQASSSGFYDVVTALETRP